MEDFIELDRGFVPYNPGQAGGRDDLSGSIASDFFVTDTWPKVLKYRAAVIVAEGGTGKSWEFRHKASQLQEQGKAAFYCPLENLESLPLARALEIGTAELEAWLSGDAEGWFFLDAVDEAKLRGPRQFERAIARYSEFVEPHKLRTHTIISTRPHAWDTYADGDTLRRRLGVAGNEISESPADAADSHGLGLEPDPSEGEETSPAAAANRSGEMPLLRELQLVPLNHRQIRAFAVAKDVGDVEQFMTAIELSNADVFANRPSDLPGLIKIWRRTDKLGTYTEVVLNNIQLKLKEHNDIHVAAGLLAPDKALIGAERLAAAATFTRRTSFLISSSPSSDDAVRDQAIDPKDVLLDWRPAEVNELLGRALFDEALYGTVRFHHRTAREYLAARWVCRLLRERKHRRSIKALFFKRPYGTEPLVVVPSLKAIVAWVSIWDQDIRDDVLRIDAKVLLEFGDASALPLGIKEQLLRDYAIRYANRSETPLSLNLRELRRLSDPGLKRTIENLLQEHSTRGDIRHLLLRLVREARIPGFGQLALSIAVDDTRDHYSRAYAIEVVGVTGSESEKASLREFLLTNAEHLRRDLTGYGIKALFPTGMTVDDVESLLRAAPSASQSSYDILQSELDHVSERLTTDSDKSALIAAFNNLLATQPYVDDFCWVNRRYAWLLKPAMELTEEFLKIHPSSPYSQTQLSILGMSLNADHLHIYTGDAQKSVLALIANNTTLKNGLFWYTVEKQRELNPANEIREYWQVMTGHRWKPQLEDVPFFLAALANRPSIDDRLIALSALMLIYFWNGTPENLLTAIRTDCARSEVLATALERHLTPSLPSPARLDSERRLRETEREAAESRRQRDANRAEWIQHLKEDPSRVGSLERADEGVVFKNTVWVYKAIREKRKGNSSWTVTNVDSLIPDFGPEVAGAFGDYCKAVWRHYVPKLRSEVALSPNSTPWIVILGLSGLAMEFAGNPSFAETLAEEEARLATRYAIWELNGFPFWLSRLWREHAHTVESVLLTEIAWELSNPTAEGRSGYILSRLRWSAETLSVALRASIMRLLQEQTSSDVATCSEALALVLRQNSEVPEEFVSAVIDHADSAADDGLKALWLAALLCLDADAAMERIQAWLDGSTSPSEGEIRLSSILNHIWGDRFHTLNGEHHSFRRPRILSQLIRIIHRHIRPEQDIVHDGAYSPGVRDHAQEARRELLNILCSIPGRETHSALLDLSHFHTRQTVKERILVLAEARAEQDCEGDPWEPHAVPEFAAEAEREPRSQYDLHLLALNRLDDLKLDLEEGDESEASILQKVENEVELRKIFANRLKQAALGKYTTGSEEELADKTRTDIRLHNPRVEARIPIELKIADKREWTPSKLRERLENQLVQQYLREARYGTFLLVRRGDSAKRDKSSWQLNGAGSRRNMSFAELVAWLREEAKQLCRANPSIDGLDVIGIDLTARGRVS